MAADKNAGNMPDKVHADPTKDFFVRMITRDISLEDCIFDLLDNCLDGVNRLLDFGGKQPKEGVRYENYWVSVEFGKDNFQIRDNCGGISLDDAVDYAFHFGRRVDAPKESDHAIGIYGIGLKRAVFKIGKQISIESTSERDSFVVNVDVDKWTEIEDWDLDLGPLERFENPGTKIVVSDIYDPIAEEFGLETFRNGLIKKISRDYSFYLQKGFEIRINKEKVLPYHFVLRTGSSFKPIHIEYEDETGVNVKIYAGAAGTPPDDTSPEIKLKDIDYYGWFVLCNDRVVIAADKTERTIWGDGRYPVWHPQYNGFMGIVSFYSSDPGKLPWTSTKREIVDTSPLYRRAIVKMKEATKSWTDYTTSRKGNMEVAKKYEREAKPEPISAIGKNEKMKLPVIRQEGTAKSTTISYSEPVAKVKAVKRSLGDPSMSNTKMGKKTFQYYFESEAED